MSYKTARTGQRSDHARYCCLFTVKSFLLMDSLAAAFFAVGSFLLLDPLAAASCFKSFFPYRFKTEMKVPQLISSKSICLEVRNFCRLLSQSVSALLSRVKDL